MGRLFGFVLIVVLIVASCADRQAADEVCDGTHTVFVQLRYMETNPFTKSAKVMDDILIENVNVYVADSEGGLVYQDYFSGSNVAFEPFDVKEGDLFNVYVIANWGERMSVGEEYELTDFVYSVSNPESIVDDKVSTLLCGKIEGVMFPSGSFVLDVPMRRVLAKVKIICDFSDVASSVEITPLRVSIKNIPPLTPLFDDNVPSEVCDGAVYEGSDLDSLETSGLDFYMFENLQGYIGEASTNKEKANMMTSEALQTASYVEMECNVVSSDKRGTMVYKFFLGTDHTNCNVLRNALQTILVLFRGSVSQDENSISVDNSALGNRVSYIKVSPSIIKFLSSKQSSKQCRLTVYPDDAIDKRVVWRTTDSTVATVDQNGLITTQGMGKCDIVATSVDRSSASYNVSVVVNNYTGG